MRRVVCAVCILAFIMLAIVGCAKPQKETSKPDTASVKVVKDTSQVELKIFCEEDRPRQYVDGNGELIGMTVELVKEIQKRVGNKDAIKVIPWTRGYEMIQKEPNIALFCMARNAERNNLFQWVGPVDEIAYAFYGKEDTPLKIESLEDAKKVKAIGVTKNEIRDIYLKGKGFTNLEYGDDTKQNYQKLMNGRIDLMPISTDQRELKSEAQELGYSAADFKMLYVFMRTQLYIAMSKEMPKEITEKWNKALEDMKNDGTYAAIYNKYFEGKDLPGPTITEFE